MIDNYIDLLGAVYSTAAKDDWREVSRTTVRKLCVCYGVPRYQAREFVKRKARYIKDRVKENVAKEAREWGAGTTRQIQRESIDELVASMVDIYLEENYDKQRKNRLP